MTMTCETLLSLLSETDQPGRTYRAIEEETRRRVGHKLFTLLHVDGEEVARVHSSDPEKYPVSGRKHMGPTPWGDLVLKRKKHFVGSDMEAIRWAFFDHELIAGMGLGAVINIPVIYNGETVGTMNMLDAEHSYTEADAARVAGLANFLIPAYLAARFAARAA